MTENLRIWDALGRTDPKHTKQFSRAGGFKGTAVKPIWITKRLTEQFGPAGIGWGVNEPSFQVVPCEGEVLVYCTVSAWHGDRSNVLWGVGGDKVQAKRQSGAFCDDEAFKKAFTDAIGNAFKSIGVGADIHMGQFEDAKYVAEVGREFAANEQPANDKALPRPDQTVALPAVSELDQRMLDDIDLCETQPELDQWLSKYEKDAVASPNRIRIEAAFKLRKAGLRQRTMVRA
jgi:hypothetical protein